MWNKPKSRRRVAVRGNLEECPDVADPAKKSLFSLLRRNYAPKMDFLLSEISNVQDTEFESDGKPDADRYSAALKDQLTGLGMEIRFVKIFTHREGDFRGTTCARIGGLVADI